MAPALCLVFASSAGAQRRGFGSAFGCNDPPVQNIPYDGRFIFVRLKYNGNAGTCYYRGEPSWAHGYGYTQDGTAESNLLKISSAVSVFRPHLDGTNVIALDDPQLFRYPVTYMVEAGYLTVTQKEAEALRKYLLKGGFLIIDDSREDFNRGKSGWANLEAMFGVVLPGLHPIDMEPSHPIFHSFFDIPSFSIIKQFYDYGPPIFRGIFVDNDPTKRLLVMINFNTDVSNYWEYSATGFAPIDESNQAYKLGVNYLIYALTH
ncbi:MAG TPA: DUF4159 domain-containing protein [Gemmatimonadaceae bacterium]|nr:DUF4159 domain-containing protein [Gemmatimonadaceae bacterium]